jgi:hypothetical protein
LFKEETLFVVGAGASAEFGMPVGRQLSEIISKMLYFEFERYSGLKIGDHRVLNWLERRYAAQDDLHPRLAACRKVSEGIFLASSIDNYIDVHSDDPLVSELGKFALALAIAEAESKSKLRVDPSNVKNRLNLRDQTLSSSWVDSFCRILFEKVRLTELDSIGSNVSMICFNYDRCIEQYLTEAVHQTYGVEYGKAHSVVNSMEIIHPYGTLGRLPGRQHGHETGTIRFGHSIDEGFDPWSASPDLKTYTEQIQDERTLDRIRGAIDQADQIVFLGFAFHPQNMQLLTSTARSSFKTVFSTGKGVSRQETREITERIVGLYSGDTEAIDSRWRDLVSIETDVSCADLFRVHWRNLSAS